MFFQRWPTGRGKILGASAGARMAVSSEVFAAIRQLFRLKVFYGPRLTVI
jgi:hypothetical protein